MRLNIESESPFIIPHYQKRKTTFMQQRENITVVTSLQETLKVLMTTKPYKGFKDMKPNTVS